MHGSGRYYRGDFERPLVSARIGPWGIATLFAAWLLTLLAAAHFGGWYQRQLHYRGIAEMPICHVPVVIHDPAPHCKPIKPKG